MPPSPAKREKECALRLLILGGTAQASALARAVADRSDIAPLLSFAGRTETPTPPPIPLRIGGFGGAAGLSAFLRDQAIDAVVDATHPFAARISTNAMAAAAEAGVPLIVFTRPAWTPGPGDRWLSVPDTPAAVALLAATTPATTLPTAIMLSRPRSGRVEARTADPAPADIDDALRPSTRARLRMTGLENGLSIFLTTGRLDLACFREAPAHRYLVRTIDSPDPNGLPPHVTVVQARPPFAVADEIALMRAHGIDLLVTKNSGGAAAAAKLTAARELGLPVLMVERPPAPAAPALHELPAVLAWIEALRR